VPILRSNAYCALQLVLIGETGFEPATARPPAGCATRLRHSPWIAGRVYDTVPSESHTNIRSIMESGDELRKCYRCGELKPIDEFSWRRKARGRRDSFCRPCRSAYGKEHYAANRQRYIDQAQIVTQRIRLTRTRYLIEYFVAHPCVDCGETDPIVLEFDHLRDKRFEISAALHGRNWEAILEEIEKCEVVCANCHRRRTARRRGTLRAILTQVQSPGGAE
jgi:hypothetical protein